MVEQREKERLEAEQREKERLEAEQREKEHLEAGDRQREIASISDVLPQGVAPLQDHSPALADATRTVESKGPIKQWPLKQLALLLVLGLILVGGLAWFVASQVNRSVPEVTVSSSTPTPSLDAAFYNRRGYDYYMKADPDDAIRDFTEAIRLKPDFAAAYYNRGAAYRSQGRTAEAQADFNKAKQLGY